MRINHLEFHNTASQWRLEKTTFNDLTLLVGASGVGKTRILKAIYTLKEIALGKSFNGIEWQLNFDDEAGNNYNWHGKYGSISKEDLYVNEWQESGETTNMIFEKIDRNGIRLAERSRQITKFKDKKIPQLSLDESLIKLLREETLIQPLYQNLLKITFSNRLFHQIDPYLYPQKSNGEYKINGFIGQLYPLYLNNTTTFKQIVTTFQDIFPLIEDIKLQPVIDGIFGKNIKIFFKERGVDQWLTQSEISSGMLKTLFLVAELHLVADGTVILIDEFENSLGSNCIDEVTSILQSNDRNIQLIITSHHPFVINNIDFEHWKVVTRNGNVVRTHDTSKFNLGRSRHKAFMQLINLEEYRTGIAL